MEKKLNFKKLLATASAFAVITGASNSAMGAAQSTQNAGQNYFSNDLHWDNAPVASGDNLIVGFVDNSSINIDVDNFYITQVDVGAKFDGITVNAGGTLLGNVDAANGGVANALTFAGGAYDITLVGGTDADRNANGPVYDGLGDVDFGGAGNGLASTLTIDTRVAIEHPVGGNVAGKADAINLVGLAQNTANATLNVKTGLNVANESWGTIKTINIGEAANAATFKIVSNAADINLNTAVANSVNFLHDDSILHLKNTGGADNAVIQNGHIGGDGDLNGKLIIESDGNAMNINIANAATIGKDIENRLQQLDFTGDEASTVNAKVYAKTINYGVKVANKALTFGAEVHGGEDSVLQFTDNATEVVFNQNAQIKLIDFNNKDKGVTVADGKVLTANLVGNAGKAAAGTLKFAAAGELAGVATKLTAVVANGAGAVTIGAGNHVVTTFKAANAGSIFDFANGTDVDGAIDNTSGNVNATKLNFAGSSTVTGAVGATAAFSEINLNGNEKAVVTFKNDTDATDFNIGAGTGVLDSTGGGRTLTAAEVKFTDADSGTLLIKGANNATIDGDVAQVGNKGTIRIAADVAANNVVFNNVVGVAADANALKRLEIENGFAGKVQLDNNTHITDVQIGSGSIQLINKNYKFGGISGDGTLLVNANNANLIGRAAPGDAINLGTTENRLAKLQFTGNYTLNIEDGVNIHVNEFASDGTGANFGTLLFKGTSIFESLAQNNGDTITAITLNANANVTILSPDTNVNGATTLGNGSTLAIAGNFDANGGLDAANAGNGTVKFININDVTINGAIGAAVSLKTIEFAGGNVEFANAVTHAAGNKFVFSGDTASTVKFNAANASDIGNNVFTNNSGATHTIVIAKAGVTDFTKDLATSVDNQLNFQLDNGVNAKITGGNATGTNFTTGANTKGELELNKAGTVINSAGEFNKSLAKVDFTKSATITNNTYAEEVRVDAGETATLGGTIQSGNFHLVNAGSTASFRDGAIVNSIIKTDNGGQGVVEFAGGATISQHLGENGKVLKTVTFANDAEKTALLDADIYAANIAMQQGVVKLASNAELNGVTTADATTLDLSNKTLTANDNLTFNGATKIKFSTTNSGNTLTGGQITIANGKNLAFANGTELAITANDKGARPVGGASHDFTLIDGDVLAVAGSKLDISKVTVGNTNDFTRWTARIGENNRLILTQIDNAVGKLRKIIGARADAADSENIDALANAALDTEGYKVVELLSTLTDSVEKTKETLDRLAPLTTVADSIESTVANVGESLGTRTISLAGNQGHPVQTRTVSSERVVGVSAGDDHARFGAWFSPFYNNTTQKARKGAAGYKGESYGASFGFDTRTNEDVIIGAAFTAANSELKHKNFKSGDKTKVNSLLFSIYGMHQLTDTWFALGSATVGTNEIRNSERKVSGLNSYQTANAKYSSMSFSGEVMFGYNHITKQATITPMGGFRYTRVNDGGYKETGTTFQNLDVSTKASNKFEVILGARASGGTFDLNGMSVTPEVHAFINHDLINKNPKQSIKLGSTTLTGKSRKPVRTTYNLGLGANAEFGMMEYGASYDAQLANKRVGHQGTLRLRVNF